MRRAGQPGDDDARAPSVLQRARESRIDRIVRGDGANVSPLRAQHERARKTATRTAREERQMAHATQGRRIGKQRNLGASGTDALYFAGNVRAVR